MADPNTLEAPVEKLSETPIEPASDAVADLLDKALETEFPPLVDDSEPSAEELAADPPEDGEEAPAEAVETPPAAETPPVPENPLARGLASLARKEKELQVREKGVKEVEVRAQAAETSLEQFKRQALEDPVEFFTALGLKPDAKEMADVAAQLYVAALGDKAPKALVDELRARQHSIAASRRVAMMEQRMKDADAAAAVAHQQSNAMSYLSTVVVAIPDELPFFQAEAKNDPQLAARAMYQRLQEMKFDPKYAGQIVPGMSDDEIAATVADSLNKQLETMAERHEKILAPVLRTRKSKAGSPPATPKVAPKTPTPVAEKKQPAAPKTLSSKNASPTKTPKKAPASEDELVAALAQDLTQGKHVRQPA